MSARGRGHSIVFWFVGSDPAACQRDDDGQDTGGLPIEQHGLG